MAISKQDQGVPTTLDVVGVVELGRGECHRLVILLSSADQVLQPGRGY